MPRPSLWTSEQKEFLLSYYPSHTSEETLQEFNTRFPCHQVTLSTLISHCYRELKMYKKNHFYTKEMIEWLIENYQTREPIEVTHKKFCEYFHTTYHSPQSLCQQAYRLGIATKYYYSEQEIEWISNNYQRTDKTVRELWKEFNSIFKNNRPFDGFLTVAKRRLGLGMSGRGYLTSGKTPHEVRRRKYGLEGTDMILSDLGNGEFLPMDKKIHKKLSRTSGNLCCGEITKTLYDIELTLSEINKIRKA